MSGSRPRRTLRRIYVWPAALALVTIAALVAGLVGTGSIDLWAVLGLSVPALLCVWALVHGRELD